MGLMWFTAPYFVILLSNWVMLLNKGGITFLHEDIKTVYHYDSVTVEVTVRGIRSELQFQAATSLSIYTLITLVVLKGVWEKPKISISTLKHSFEILVKALPPDRKLTYNSILYEHTHKDAFTLLKIMKV